MSVDRLEPVASRPARPPQTVPAVGRVEAIHIVAAKRGPMESVERVAALAGLGLDGDRYTRLALAGSPDVKPDRHLTLIEAEEVERLADDHGIVLVPGETRRNVTTRGIRLNELVGRRFRVGAVACEAMKLCEPCQDLVDMLDKPVLGPLVHRAGITARLLTDGEITVGAEIAALD